MVATLRLLLLVLACGAIASAQITDGGFEASLPGSSPGAPWIVTGGNVAVSDVADDLFPSEGGNYLVIDAGDTGPATAGYGPHMSATVAQVAQTFVRPNGPNCALLFDWEFLLAESPGSVTFDDFLTVDLVETLTGAHVANLLFIDSGSLAGTPPYTNVPGAGSGSLAYVPSQSTIYPVNTQAPAGFKRAWLDLTTLTVGGASYTLLIAVGNVGDTSVDSVAYIDNVTLTMAQVNTPEAALRVLGAAHQDGVFETFDTAGDIRPESPFSFPVEPGQRFAIRASSTVPGTPWALFHGSPAPVGTDFGPLGVSNLDLTQPFGIVLDGIGGTDLLSLFLGTISPSRSTFIPGTMPATFPVTAPPFTLQALMLDPSLPIPIRHTAATDVRPELARIPLRQGGGTALAGGANNDDGFTAVTFGTFGSFNFYGNSHTEVNVGSNGFLTFSTGSGDFTESESDMVTGPPRIAALWDDFNPSSTSTLGLETAEVQHAETSDTYTVIWRTVPEFGSGINANSFAVQLYQNGVITLYFGATTLTDGLVGISPGGLPAPTFGVSSNLSSISNALGNRGSTPSSGLRFEQFAHLSGSGFGPGDAFDLMTVGLAGPPRITFVPNGSGYTFFTGTR